MSRQAPRVIVLRHRRTLAIITGSDTSCALGEIANGRSDGMKTAPTVIGTK